MDKLAQAMQSMTPSAHAEHFQIQAARFEIERDTLISLIEHLFKFGHPGEKNA